MNNKCRINGTELLEVIDLGNQFVSNFVEKKDILSGDKSSLKLGIGKESNLLQLCESYSPEKMYKKYWYKSGINEEMVYQLSNIVRSSKKLISLCDNDIVLDIASNDGTLLTFWEDTLVRIGIDPSDVAKNSSIYKDNNIILLNDFFSSNIYYTVATKPAKVITIAAMFYDIDNPIEFLKDLKSTLDKNGLLVIQLSYSPLMFIQNAFDNIGHEHLCYYTLSTIETILNISGFDLVDVELNETNCGSFRVYAKHKEGQLKCPKHVLDIGHMRLDSMRWYEINNRINTRSKWLDFGNRISSLKYDMLSWLEDQKRLGKTIIGYGASTKGNTLLQTYEITPDLLPYIADRSIDKHGLYTVGTGIEIISEEQMRSMKPDYLLVLPWTFISMFKEREAKLLSSGTKLVTPLPQLSIFN